MSIKLGIYLLKLQDEKFCIGQLACMSADRDSIPPSGRAGFEPALLRLTAGRITIMLSTRWRDTTPGMTSLRLSTGLIRLDSYFVFVNTSLDYAIDQMAGSCSWPVSHSIVFKNVES